MLAAEKRTEGYPVLVVNDVDDDPYEVRKWCGDDHGRWMQAALQALIDSGWTPRMLIRLHVDPADEWHDLVHSHFEFRQCSEQALLPQVAAHPVALWTDLAIATLRTRDWSYRMIANVLPVHWMTVFRHTRRRHEYIKREETRQLQLW